MVLALAGRRIDAADQAQPRFPPDNVTTVRQKLHQLFVEQRMRTLVCSAACGADLLALDEAHKLGLEAHVLLPSDVQPFREGSVVDRPGPWGEIFDLLIRQAEAENRLVILAPPNDATDPYLAANQSILQAAQQLAARTRDQVAAALVWDCLSRGQDDVTEDFGRRARQMGLNVFEIDTR